jgi:hypothetical protein
MLRNRIVVCALLIVIGLSAVAQPAVDAPAELRSLLVKMVEDIGTGLLLVRLSADAVASAMIQRHLEQIEALLVGADEEAAARFGWPREALHGLLNDAAELTALLGRLALERAPREELFSFARNVQALLALTVEEVRAARRQRLTAHDKEPLLRASAFLVATLGVPINAYPGGLYTIAWRLGITEVLEAIAPLWRPLLKTGEPP